MSPDRCDQIFYLPVADEVEIGQLAHQCKLPLLLKGPTGSGKSRYVEFLAQKLDLKLFTISCHEETSSIDLVGRHLVIGQETKWVDGPLTRAVREGAIVYLDEVAEARADTLVLLHALTDHRRTLFIDRTNEEIAAPESFMLVASYNPGYQHGFKELKASTRQRFISMAFDYPDSARESAIVSNESKADEKIVNRLVKLAGKIRNLHNLGLKESVSTRLLIDSAKLIQGGLPPRRACHVAIAQVLTDDNTTLTSLDDLIALHF